MNGFTPYVGLLLAAYSMEGKRPESWRQSPQMRSSKPRLRRLWATLDVRSAVILMQPPWPKLVGRLAAERPASRELIDGAESGRIRARPPQDAADVALALVDPRVGRRPAETPTETVCL